MENIWAFLEQTLTASVVAVLLLITKRLFLDKLSPRWQYGVWTILALRMLLPAGLLGRTLLPGGRVLLNAVKTWVERGLSSALTDPYSITQVKVPVPLIRLVKPNSVTDLLFCLYAAGVVALLLWFGLTYLALRRRVARGRAPDREVMDQLQRVAGQYRLNLPRRMVVLPEAESAFVCGPLSPVLVLPDRKVDDKVVLHELLHLKHGDLWAGVGMCVLRCLHWCNPLLWYCWNLAQNDCEALCDQRVLERLAGEDRRTYGVILLSMADQRYARAPGTTSMANGGRNIKARIGAIARFKRYPKGMELASKCVAVVLAVACLVGTGEASVPDYNERGGLALAKARVNRPTTVAGALDTYAQAVLYDSPVYYTMVAPEGASQQVEQIMMQPFESEFPSHDSPFWNLGFGWSCTWCAEWSVMNLRSDGADGYTGTLFFVPQDGYDTQGLVAQQVAVRPEGMFWTVEPLEELHPLDVEPGYILSDSALPVITYVAEEAGLSIEIDCRYRLGTGYNREEIGPLPHTGFTEYDHSIGGRVYDLDTHEAVSLDGISIWPLNSQGKKGGSGTEVCLPKEVGSSGGGTSGPSDTGVGLDCVVALALEFPYHGQTHTCVALPEEVGP